jgi:hypothetical protein
MLKKKHCLVAMGLLLVFATSQLLAANKTDDKKKSESATEVGPYLGVGVEPLHPAFSAHLPGSLLGGQGVLVSTVAKDSPADKAGIKAHDILAAYGDQKLFSPNQMVKLVRADKPGKEVKLQLVREGKLLVVPVTLGDQPPHIASREHSYRDLWERQFPWKLPRFSPNQPSSPPQSPRPTNKKGWESFDSLTLKKLDGNRFKAEVEYLDKEGKNQHHEFEGTREEIRKQIESEKDLPDDEREQLLGGLNLRRGKLLQPFPWDRAYDPFNIPWFEWPDPFEDF